MTTLPPSPDPSSPSGRFVELMLRHQHDLTRFLRALGVSGADVEETLQQTLTSLWEKWAEFDPERDFLPWAFKFAHLEALKLRHRQQRDHRIFSDELVALLAAEAEREDQLFQPRLEALRHCLRQLKAFDYDLMHAKYAHGLTAQQLARQTRLTVKAIYRRIDRIRNDLAICIRFRSESIGP